MPEVQQRELPYSDAIREGLDMAMEKDSNVIVIGEGVPDPKAIFGTTAHLQQKYGHQRVFDMPLAENGLTGICIGAAIAGLRPVMVHQRIDFALLSMDQLVNNAAKWRYMFNQQASVPLVVRVLIGRGWGQGPQHSQSLQAMFAQIPGLRVVMPVTAHDAKGMLVAAIESDEPIIFIEHRWLHHVRDHVREEYYRCSLDQARTMREGDTLTIAAFSYMVLEALLAAKALASIGVDVEVIDMRSARPLDVDSVVKSVQKTGHLLVADTAHKTGSIAGELISQVMETAFDALKKAPARIASPDQPVPTSHFMSGDYYPGPQAIADGVLAMLGISKQEIDSTALSAQFKTERPHDVPNRDFHGPF